MYTYIDFYKTTYENLYVLCLDLFDTSERLGYDSV